MRASLVIVVVLLFAPVLAHAQTLTRPPEIATFVPATYPPEEHDAGREAVVGFEVLIAADGTVAEATVTESAGDAFDAAALAAVRQFVFRPAEIDGAPAAIRIVYRYEFVLEEETPPVPVTAALAGVVRDRRSGDPLPNVTVEIRAGEATFTATTDGDGRFDIEVLPAGTAQVTLSGEALATIFTEETLGEGERVEVAYDVALAPPPDEEDEGEHDDIEIVVTAPPLRRSVVSTEVRAEEARLVPGTSGDVVRVVESLPGVARSTAGSGALVVWGAAPEDTRIYVDGVPIPRLMHEGGLRSVVQPDFVRSIELIPGGYGPSWGRGLGGLVSIRTDTPTGDGVHASVSLDALDVSAMLRGSVDDRVRVAASGRVSLLDLYAAPLLGADAVGYLPIPQYRDGQARGCFDLGGGDSLELVGLVSSDRFTRGVPNADPALSTEEARSLDFQRFYLRWLRDRGDGTVITVTPYVGLDQRTIGTRTGSVLTSIGGDTWLVGLRASARARAFDWLSFEAGVDAEVSSTTLHRQGSIGLPAREGDIRVFGQPPPDSVDRDDWTIVSVGIAPYVEGDVELFDGTLHVLPGLRIDPYARSASRRAPVQQGEPELGLFTQDFRGEPRLTLRWDPMTELGIRAAVGLVHQAPRPEDLSATFGTPTLPVSEAVHTVLGATLRPIQGLSIEATGFFTSSHDLPMRSAAAAPLRAQALEPTGEGRAYGVQALIRQELTEGFSGWIAYTLSRSERLDRPGEAWRLSDYDQTHVLTTVFAYRIPGIDLDVGLRFRYATGAPRTNVVGAVYDAARDRYTPLFGAHNGIRVPDFVQLDLRVGRRFDAGDVHIDVFLEVLNVWNQANAEEIVYGPDFTTRSTVSSLPILPVLGIRGEL